MSRQVPFLDLTRDTGLKAELGEVFQRVLDMGHFILGPEVDAFERECAPLVGTKHAVGVSSGTDALLVALMAADVGVSDEVICPAYSFFATAGSIVRVGAKPVFVDVLPDCFTLDPVDLARKMTVRTKAIIPVHLFGQCCDMDAVAGLAKTHGLVVIEDAAQAIGAKVGGRAAGALGQMGCFSFFPSKNLGGFGDGGLVTTDSDALSERLRILRSHGAKPKYHHRIVGGNFRLDELQAALLRVKLRRLDTFTARRRENAARYDRLFAERSLSALITLPRVNRGAHVFNQYVICSNRREELRTYLKDSGVGTEVYYPRPLHEQECFAALGYKPGDFPVSERLASTSLALPIFPELEADEIEYVVATIAAFFRTPA